MISSKFSNAVSDAKEDAITEKIATIFRDSFPAATQIRISGILSYSMENQDERFLKVDIKIDDSNHINDVSVGGFQCNEMADSAVGSKKPQSHIFNDLNKKFERELVSPENLVSNSNDCVNSSSEEYKRARRKCRTPRRQPISLNLLENNQIVENEGPTIMGCASLVQDGMNIEDANTSSFDQMIEFDNDTNTVSYEEKAFLSIPETSKFVQSRSRINMNPIEKGLESSELFHSQTSQTLRSANSDCLKKEDAASNSNASGRTDSLCSDSTDSDKLSPITPLTRTNELPGDAPDGFSADKTPENIKNSNLVDAVSACQFSVNEENAYNFIQPDNLIDTLNLLRLISAQNSGNALFTSMNNNKLFGNGVSLPNAQSYTNQHFDLQRSIFNTVKQPNIASISVCPTLTLIGTIEPCITSNSSGTTHYSTTSNLLGSMKNSNIMGVTQGNQCISLNRNEGNNMTFGLAINKQVQSECPTKLTTEIRYQVADLPTGTKQDNEPLLSANKLGTCSVSDSIVTATVASVKPTENVNTIMANILSHCVSNPSSRGPMLSTCSYGSTKPKNLFATPNISQCDENARSSTKNSNGPTNPEFSSKALLLNTRINDPNTYSNSNTERTLKRKANRLGPKSTDENLTAAETATAIDKILQTIKVCMNNSQHEVTETRTSKICTSLVPPDVHQVPTIRLGQLNDGTVFVPVTVSTVSSGTPLSIHSKAVEEPGKFRKKEVNTACFNKTTSSDDGISNTRRSYRCHYCGKLFNRKFCRERHERLHTGIKPYTCEVCNEKFIRLEDKKRHVRSLQHYSPARVFSGNIEISSELVSGLERNGKTSTRNIAPSGLRDIMNMEMDNLESAAKNDDELSSDDNSEMGKLKIVEKHFENEAEGVNSGEQSENHKRPADLQNSMNVLRDENFRQDIKIIKMQLC